MYRALGFPPQFFTVMFAVPRIVGYLSHWKESLADPDTKIMRPQEDYRVSVFRVLCTPSGACKPKAFGDALLQFHRHPATRELGGWAGGYRQATVVHWHHYVGLSSPRLARSLVRPTAGALSC